MLLYVVALLLWLGLKGKLKNIGLRKTEALTLRTFPPLILLGVPVALNLIAQNSLSSDFGFYILMLSTVIAEEILFRGVLVDWLKGRNPIIIALASSVAFGIFHLVNLPEVGLSQTLLQMLFAFSVGMLYAAVRIRHKSIIPCIISHYLSNITAIGITQGNTVLLCICMLICLGGGIYLCRQTR